MTTATTLDILSANLSSTGYGANTAWQTITGGQGGWEQGSDLRGCLADYLRDCGEHEAAEEVMVADATGGVIEACGFAYAWGERA